LSRCREYRLAIALIRHDIDFRAKRLIKLVPRLGLVIVCGATENGKTARTLWGAGS
jgi:hypothetical protein